MDSVQYTVAPARVCKCVSVRSGKVADVVGASNADGATVPQWRDTGKPNQQWAFQSTEDGYHTVTCVNSGKVLDVKGGSTADGATLSSTATSAAPTSDGPSAGSPPDGSGGLQCPEVRTRAAHRRPAACRRRPAAHVACRGKGDVPQDHLVGARAAPAAAPP
ncbi:RICIN domain-containing protein [Streptomyces sp. NPDC000658]|uniref:RICIN domain-containing protein n=1 Tax=Streptomyces sp. NPDC000658 TaxID=3154266 RepID=UPI00332416D4